MSLNPKREIFQVLGCYMQDTTLIRNNDYKCTTHDFPEVFHKSIFASINNLVREGIAVLDEITIDNYLSSYPEKYAIFSKNNGIEYLTKIKNEANLLNFEYNFNRLKKFSMLRRYQEKGFSAKEIYDDEMLETKAVEIMQEEFDKKTLNDIAKHFDLKSLEVKEEFCVNMSEQSKHAGTGAKELLRKRKETPLMGWNCGISKILTTLIRGFRKGQFTLFSSASGFGKSRTSLAIAGSLGAKFIWSFEQKKYLPNPNGLNNKILYIGTEMDLLDEVDPILISFVSGINQDKIEDGIFTEEEEERLFKAIDIIEDSHIWLEHMPEFDIRSLEQKIEEFKIKYNVDYVVFDYIQLTDNLVSEAVFKRKGMSVREDQVLLSLSKKLKDLTKKYNIGMFSMTQLNGEWKNTEERDTSLLRGARALGDKLDVGIIALPPSKLEKENISPIVSKLGFISEPNMVLSCYKIRKGKTQGKTDLKVFLHADLGTMRYEDLFCTTKTYEIFNVEKTTVNFLTCEDEQEYLKKDTEKHEIEF